GAKGTIFDIEFNNHSSFYYNKDFPDRGCRAIKFEVGILRPDWLRDAQFLETLSVDNRTTHAFTKAEFITYFEDAETKLPVRWIFHSSGGQFEVMSWREGEQAPEEYWELPLSCFDQEAQAYEKGALKEIERDTDIARDSGGQYPASS
ncbi:hypothetical protein CEUSTIGMA_g2273.t1, partial [Chlamydomonas eustigma]